jgi:hypothetical protein
MQFPPTPTASANAFGGNPPVGKVGGGTSGRHDLEAGPVQFFGGRRYGLFIFVAHANEDLAAFR